MFVKDNQKNIAKLIKSSYKRFFPFVRSQGSIYPGWVEKRVKITQFPALLLAIKLMFCLVSQNSGVFQTPLHNSSFRPAYHLDSVYLLLTNVEIRHQSPVFIWWQTGQPRIICSQTPWKIEKRILPHSSSSLSTTNTPPLHPSPFLKNSLDER